MPKSIFNHVEEILLAPSGVVEKPLKILLVGAEVSPYSSVGGLSQVLGYLSRALRKRGYDTRVFIPKFGMIDEKKYKMEMVAEGLKVPTGNADQPNLICNVKLYESRNYAPAYFLENKEYYELRANVYGYKDDHIRWALLSRGVLEFLSQSSDWIPDIIHANDWHTGHITNYLRTEFLQESHLAKMASVFTIHNPGFQGNFDHKNVSDLNFDDGKSQIAEFFSERLLWQNFLRRGIMYADVVSTVSEGYAKEILRPEFGEGLDKLLKEVRGKLFGILNGIGYEEMNSATDKLLPVNFDIRSLEKRTQNKLALQDEFDLPQDEKIPLLSYVGRMDEQKGVDLIVEVLNHLLDDFDVQFVVVGGGDLRYVGPFRELQRRFPQKVGAHLMSDFSLPRMIFGGADLILLPSRFEPCGIVQMEAMRYGCIPIVRAVGGLADSVENFDPEKETGVGFVFKEFDQWAFFAQVVRALEIYRQKNIWRGLQKRAMSQDNSWEARASEYMNLYSKALQLHAQSVKKGSTIGPQFGITEYD